MRAGVELLEFDYLQARLGLPADWSGPELPHLLGYISKGRNAHGQRDAGNVLRLIYTRLNPEGVYDGEAAKDGLYRSYLKELAGKKFARVPASVRLLSARDIAAGAPCARTVSDLRNMSRVLDEAGKPPGRPRDRRRRISSRRKPAEAAS